MVFSVVGMNVPWPALPRRAWRVTAGLWVGDLSARDAQKQEAEQE